MTANQFRYNRLHKNETHTQLEFDCRLNEENVLFSTGKGKRYIIIKVSSGHIPDGFNNIALSYTLIRDNTLNLMEGLGRLVYKYYIRELRTIREYDVSIRWKYIEEMDVLEHKLMMVNQMS